MPIIVGFGHRRYVGKDSAANFAVSYMRQQTRGKLVLKTGFASKFKAMCHDLYGWAGLQDEEYYEAHPELKDVVIPALGKSPRNVWIEFGTTVGRAIYDNTWVMYPIMMQCDYLFIKDVRFPNEADEILNRGGYVVRVDNPRVEKFDDVADSGLVNYTRWSATLLNDGDLALLNQRTIQLLQSLALRTATP